MRSGGNATHLYSGAEWIRNLFCFPDSDPNIPEAILCANKVKCNQIFYTNCSAEFAIEKIECRENH